MILLLASLQVGALALWCSAFFRTTVGAFLGTYIFGMVLYGGPPAVIALLHEMGSHQLERVLGDMIFVHIPPVSLDLARSGKVPLWQITAPLAGTALLFLGLAVFHLPRRAFAPATRAWRRLFAYFDRIAQRANRILGNIVVTRRTHALPESEPVTWRERRAGVIGNPAHLIRLLVLIEVLVVLLARWVGGFPAVFEEAYGLSMLGAIVGTLSVLVLTVIAANAFVSERVHQTLEVLLTTPLVGAEIARQKARALRALILVLAVPLLTIFGYEALLEANFRYSFPHPFSGHQSGGESPWFYIVCATLTVVVYLPLVSWLSLWIGLKARTRLRAIVISLLAVIGWCVAPLVLVGGILDIEPERAEAHPESLLYLLSPLSVPIANEFHGLNKVVAGAPWLPVLVNFTCYLMILRGIKNHCLKNADRWLRA